MLCQSTRSTWMPRAVAKIVSNFRQRLKRRPNMTSSMMQCVQCRDSQRYFLLWNWQFFFSFHFHFSLCHVNWWNRRLQWSIVKSHTYASNWSRRQPTDCICCFSSRTFVLAHSKRLRVSHDNKSCRQRMMHRPSEWYFVAATRKQKQKGNEIWKRFDVNFVDTYDALPCDAEIRARRCPRCVCAHLSILGNTFNDWIFAHSIVGRQSDSNIGWII